VPRDRPRSAAFEGDQGRGGREEVSQIIGILWQPANIDENVVVITGASSGIGVADPLLSSILVQIYDGGFLAVG
jgi:hypothetical protein